MAVEVPYLVPGGNEESSWVEGSPQSGFDFKAGSLTLRNSCVPEVDTSTASSCVTISPVWSNDGVATEGEWTRSEATSRSSHRQVAIVVYLTDKLLKHELE